MLSLNELGWLFWLGIGLAAFLLPVLMLILVIRLFAHNTSRAGQFQPSDVGLAPRNARVPTVLGKAWRAIREHVRHSLFWIGLCAYLVYQSWFHGADPSRIQAEAIANRQPIVGAWYLPQGVGPYTVLEFLPDGTVISRTARKVEKGTYEVRESRIALSFPGEPLFWDPKIHALPDRFAISGNELSLYATSGGAEIASAQVYRFKRLKEPDGEAVAAVTTN